MTLKLRVAGRSLASHSGSDGPAAMADMAGVADMLEAVATISVIL